MPTDITVSNLSSRYATERPWLAGEHGADMPDHAQLDFNLFTHANFTTDGLIRSGCLLGKVTATGKFGPYDPAATDGRQTAVSLVFNTTTIPADKNTIMTDATLEHCGVRVAGLPYKSGPGSLDAAARTALRLIKFYG